MTIESRPDLIPSQKTKKYYQNQFNIIQLAKSEQNIKIKLNGKFDRLCLKMRLLNDNNKKKKEADNRTK